MRRAVCGAIDSPGFTSASRLIPSGVSSNTHENISAGTKPTASNPTSVFMFVNKRDGWAIGGYAVQPIYPDSGGAYISHDGGLTWTMEADVGVALQTCTTADYHLFCAGTDSAATTHVFERDFDHIRVGGFDADDAP